MEEKKKKFNNKTGLSIIGTSQKSITPELFERVRRRLNRTKKELPDSKIRQIVIQGNIEIGNWIINNPEGFELYKKFGFLSVSKYLPKQFRTDKEEKIEKIKSLDISEATRAKYLKRYNVDIGSSLNYPAMLELKIKIPHLNLHSFYYIYKVMWFNHRNCDFYKSSCWWFASNKRVVNKALYEKIMDGKDYYSWQFSDWYRFKIKRDEY